MESGYKMMCLSVYSDEASLERREARAEQTATPGASVLLGARSSTVWI